jgi:hypothetical protein
MIDLSFCDVRRRIRLLGVPPWRFALGWRSRSMSGSLLMLDHIILESGDLALEFAAPESTAPK